MTFHIRHLKHRSALTVPVVADGTVNVIHGESDGYALSVEGEAAGIWVPLHGSLQVRTTGLVASVTTGEVLVTELDSRTTVFGHANAHWLALLGGERAWCRVLSNIRETLTPNPQLLPSRHQASYELQCKAKELVRVTGEFGQENSAYAVIYDVIALQASLHSAIARCPGRTYARKKQAFLRLQRVRNFISTCCDQEIDNAALARMANYSPTHFIRTFDEVFLETPHAYLVKQRLQLAKRLLHSGNLAVREVALASGFENRSAFSRLFRQHFGMTANEARHYFLAVVEG